MSEQKLTSLQRRILGRVKREPRTFVDLLVFTSVRPDTLNRAIGGLLEAGLIERCTVGNFGGVRINTGKRGYDD